MLLWRSGVSIEINHRKVGRGSVGEVTIKGFRINNEEIADYNVRGIMIRGNSLY